jgi:hypothetical protein
MYLLAERGVVRLSDGAHITPDMMAWADYRAWLKAGGVPAAPAPVVPALGEVAARLKRAITARRDAVQYGGATIGGVTLKTDHTSTTLLGQAQQFGARNPNRPLKVKGADGTHVTLYPAQIDALFDALAERSALCWDNEAAHYAAVDAIVNGPGTDAEKIASLEAYDLTTGWPDRPTRSRA